MTRATLALVLAAAACGAPVVEVGTGVTEFRPIAPGSEVPIVRGPQGGQHIWTSVRSKGIDPSRANIEITVTFADTGETVCESKLNDLLLTPNGDWDEFPGVTCFVREPDAAAGRGVLVRGRVSDPDGRAAEDEVAATATWDPGR